MIRGGYGLFWDSAEGREIDGSADIYPYVSRGAGSQSANQATPLQTTDSLFPNFTNVPNEFLNDAFSEPPAGVGASVTLVPPTLSNGSFYLTVYGSGPYTVSLFNGQPVITTVDYVFAITNDAPARVGWRYYTVVSTAEQLGSLGWELDLANQPPGCLLYTSPSPRD